MPRYCFVECILPPHWNADHLIRQIGLEHAAYRFPASEGSLGEDMLVSIPALRASKLEDIEQQNCLIVSRIEPATLDRSDEAIKAVLDGIDEPFSCFEVMYWPQSREMLRAFLRKLATAEPKMRIAFAGAAISASNFLRVDALVPPPGKWDWHHYRELYDEEVYFGTYFPVPKQLAQEVRYVRDEEQGDTQVFI